MADDNFAAGNTPARPTGNPELDARRRAASRSEALTDIASEIRRWGSVGLFGAADRLEAVAQEVAAETVVLAKWPELTAAFLEVVKEGTAAAKTAAAEPTAAVTSAEPEFVPDAERLRLALEAVWQIEALMNLVVDTTDKMIAGTAMGSEDMAIRGIAIRTRDLACAVMSSQEAAADIDELHRTVHGTYRAAKGAAA